MKVTIEGTPEEIAQAFPYLNLKQPAKAVPETNSHSTADPPENFIDGKRYVSVELAMLILSRRGLSPAQKIVLQTLYRAHPSAIATVDLQKKTAMNSDEFRGLMGAFGRRLTHTKGYIDPTWFFIQTWDSADGSYRYSLPESVREAMRRLKLV